MKNPLNIIITGILIYSLASCASSKKIDFKTAYRFSTYKYQKSIDSVEVTDRKTISEDELEVSASLKRPEVQRRSVIEIEDKIYNKIGISSEEAEVMEIEELKDRFKALSWKEKLEIRRSIKTELKQLRLEAENAHSTLDVEAYNELSELTRWSIIVGSTGLLLLVLGAIFTPLLTFFGAILVVGAAVLFIIDQA